MNIKWIIAVALFSLFLFGCTTKDGIGAHVDRDTAVTLARRETPLRGVDKIEGSPGLPFRHAITGRDVKGRAMVVWVKTEVTEYVYLDELITQEKAITLAESAGLQSGGGLSARLGHLIGQDQRVYWEVIDGPHYVWVDARNGEVLRSNVVGKP
jgi:uncharacterized protein YpmB